MGFEGVDGAVSDLSGYDAKLVFMSARAGDAPSRAGLRFRFITSTSTVSVALSKASEQYDVLLE